MSESPVLLHIWSVHPEAENALLEQLGEMLDHVRHQPGFVSARILASPDRTSIAVLVEMETVEDRRRLQELPEVRKTLRDVEGGYNLVIKLYDQVETYGHG